MRLAGWVLLSGAMLAAAPVAIGSAAAQSVAVEASTDARVRGLSWSDGRPALAAAISLPVGDWRLDARGTSLRGSRRHDGADLGLDTALRYSRDVGGWRASAGIVHHAFVARAASNYVELEAGAAYLIGPLDLALTAAWAPSQDTIGGDNLYLRAGASAGVPGTPYTVFGHVGRSIGPEGRDRATRLRPDGDYTDWRLGAERVAGRLTLGLQLTGTSIDTPVTPTRFTDRHVGTRLAGTARLDF